MRGGSASYAQLRADEIAELQQAQIAQLQTELHPARTDISEEEAEAAEQTMTFSGRPAAPADRALRQTSLEVKIRGGLYFTPDAQTLVHGGYETKELSLWDLRTGARTAALARSAPVYTSAVSADGQLLCVAAGDGLAMYQLTPRDAGGQGEPPRAELQWEIAPGTRYCGVAFSRDGTLVAAVRWESGVLEIRDARSKIAVRVIEDFPAVQASSGHTCLAFSEGVLAVTGRQGMPNRKQVRVYQVQLDFEVLTTLSVPGDKAHSLAMSPDGTKLAVGMDRDGVAIYSSHNSWKDAPLCLGGTVGVASTAFSHDGRFLCTGSRTAGGIFSIWDVEAAVCIRAIRTGDWHACAFSPADDLLATGGGDNDHPARLHELSPPAPLDCFAMPGEAKLPISAAAASEAVVVLASGKRLAVRARCDGRVLWQTDLEEVAMVQCDAALALQPTGEQVAVGIHKLNLVSVRDLQSGKELYQLKNLSDLWALKYSPAGSLLMVGNISPEFTKLYDAATGDELHSFENKGGKDMGIDPCNKFLAMTSEPGKNSLVRVESREEVLALEEKTHASGGAFNDAGDRMAYSIHEHSAVALCDKAPDGSWRETQRWDIGKSCGIRWSIHTEFSPDDGRYLLLVAVAKFAGDKTGRGRIAFLDTETGEEPAWSRCFRALMLPPGTLHWQNSDNPGDSVRWVRSSQTQLPAAAHHRDEDPQPPVLHEPTLILQAAIGDQLYLIDVATYIHAFEEDGNFSLEQLNRLSDSDPDAIPTLLEKWPHVVNFRDEQTGDTVMHHCARAGKSEATQKWLSGSVPVAPWLENKHGMRAMREAVLKMQYPTASEMVQQLDPMMPLARTEILTADLVAMAERFPRQIVGIIKTLLGDGTDRDGGNARFRLFRKQKEFSLLKRQLDTTLGFAVRASASGGAEVPWPEYLGDVTEGPKCDCELQVLALAGFVAMSSDSSPFTRLFRACEAESEQLLNDLLSTKLMDVATVYKWQKYVSQRVVRRLYLMMLHFAFAAAAMLMSTQFFDQVSAFQDSGSWAGDWSVATVNAAMSCDVLQIGLLLSNTLVFVVEMRQLKLAYSEQQRRQDAESSCGPVVAAHFDSWWNRCDIAGIAALYVASVAHFARWETVLRQVGAVGVLLNAFSLLQLLRPFEKTGPLIKTVIEILADIEGFIYIIIVLLWGFSVSFAVSMPSNSAFLDNTTGPLAGLVTSFDTMVGSIHMSEYDNAESTVFFLVFLFLVVVVMLNLLIAIMSDSYEKVKESEVVEARKLRAQTIIDEEVLMSDAERSNPVYFPQYLQVLQATETKEEVWAGLSGKMVSEIMKVEEQVVDSERSMKQEMGEVKQEIGEMKQKMKQEMKQEVGKVQQEMCKMKQEMGEMKQEMKHEIRELKALMAQLLEQTK